MTGLRLCLKTGGNLQQHPPSVLKSFTRKLSSGWVSSTVKDFTKQKKIKRKNTPKLCPFWSWCFWKAWHKLTKKKLALRPKQKELDPSDLSPNEKAPWIHPGDGFFKEGASCFHGGNLFLMGGSFEKGWDHHDAVQLPPWSDTNPSNPSIGLRKIEAFRPAEKNSWPDHNCWSRKKMAQVYSIRFCSLEICETCELVFPSLSALQSSRCIELSLATRR